MIIRALKIFAIYIFYVSSTMAQDSDNRITIGSKHSIHSEILNEDRAYLIHLPDGYTNEKKYPIAYMTDGDFLFHLISGVIEYNYNTGIIPEMILVGIPTNRNRARDLTPSYSMLNSYGDEYQGNNISGGADNFLKFIMTELSPLIEKEYSVANYRMFIGHSHGGLFAVYSFLEAPDFFNSIISIDPSLYWDKEALKKRLTQKISNPPTTKKAIYISSANNVGDSFLNEDVMVRAQKDFVDALSPWKSDTLKVNLERFEDENHGTAPLISAAHGLAFIFESYIIPFERIEKNPDSIFEHFENASKELGYHIAPPEWAVNASGYVLIRKNKPKEAIEYFLTNVKNHPNSSNAYDSLSDAYKEIGNRDMVIKSLEKAIELDPNAEGSKMKLKDFLGSDSQ